MYLCLIFILLYYTLSGILSHLNHTLMCSLVFHAQQLYTRGFPDRALAAIDTPDSVAAAAELIAWAKQILGVHLKFSLCCLFEIFLYGRYLVGGYQYFPCLLINIYLNLISRKTS
jgi:hypothetical protein